MAIQTAAGLSVQKYWSASVYTQASRAVATYSQRISKAIAEWAAQDNTHANSLQQAAYLLVQAGGNTTRYGDIPTKTRPFAVPQMKAAKPQEAEDAALSILAAVAKSEAHCARTFREAADMPLSRPIFQYLDLAAMVEVSRAREQIALEMKTRINDKVFWTSEHPCIWRCLQCGGRHHGKSALDECPACHAGRAHQTNGGW